MAALTETDAALTAAEQAGELRLAGDMTVWTLDRLPASSSAQRIDLSGLGHLDTAGAWWLAERRQAGAELSGLSETHGRLVETVAAAIPKPDAEPPAPVWWRFLLDQTGRWMTGALAMQRELAEYTGRFLAAGARAIRHPGDFRLTSYMYHCGEMGLRAVPIVALISFLIGVVIAFQGATLLKQFGAEIFVVDLISISILRELGILLTAIVVAGRTASALTSSIGSMKMNEEIDAMRTLGLDPDMVLILPRVLALVTVLPVLALISDLAGVFGGALMAWITLDISPAMFVNRMVAGTSVTHALVGLVKAPVFAMLIAIIGCHAGMKVGKDAASLGSMTSSSVVRAIFAVIVADALFSIFFSEVNW